MFGMGIGGFVQGLNQSMQAVEAREDRRERRLDRAEARADRQEARAARQLERANTESIAGIGRAANEEIAAGGDRQDVEQRYWQQIQDEYAKQGRPDLARQFQQWRSGDEAQRGIRHFQNGLVMFDMARRQDGSYDSEMMSRGLSELRRAQQLSAYGGDRQFQFRPIVEGEGQGERTIGYRIEFRDDDGKTISRDIAPSDIPRAAAMMFNPQAAFEDRRQQDERARQSRDRSATTERSEWQTAEEQVRKEYEERRTAADASAADRARKPWGELPDADRDTLIRARQGSRTPPTQRENPPPGLPGMPGLGGVTAPQGRVAFDRITGQVAGPAPAARAAEKRAEPPPNPNAPVAPSAPVPIEDPRASEAIRVEADRAIQRGDRADVVARGLERAGIPPEQWPESVSSALARRRQTMPAGSATTPYSAAGGLMGLTQ